MPSRKFFCALASVMVASCFSGSSRAAGGPAARALGLMSVSGSVWVDHQPAPPTSVVFPGDTVTTKKDSAAIVRFSSGMTVALTENSEVELPREADSTELRMREGALTINNPSEEAARIEVLGASVVVRGNTGLAAVCRISALGNRAEVIADRGEAEILGRGNPIHIAQGRFARLEAGALPGAPQAGRKAGTVTAEIPTPTVAPQSSGAGTPLKVNDSVNWQDWVRTTDPPTARVRIQLLDGSLLNVGAGSTMHIVAHNPQTQQTQVELTLGKMRAQVVKLTKSGSSFQVKTQTAVIGVVGTIFVVEADQNSTKVTCIEGKVAVQNVNLAVQGQVQLGPGQTTSVAAGEAPTAASAATATELQTAVERTDIVRGAGQATTGGQAPATGGGQGGATTAGGQATSAGGGQAGTAVGGAAPGVSGAGTGISVTTGAVAAAGGASAVAGATALSKANDANNALAASSSTIQSATSAANAATTAITQSQQSTPSASTPCGCGP